MSGRLGVFVWFFLGSAASVFAQDSGRTVLAAPLDQYVGQYRQLAEPDRIEAIYAAKDGLYVEGPRSSAKEMKLESVDTFRIDGTDFRLQFQRDSSGKVTGLKELDGATQTGVIEAKVSDSAARLNHFRAYTRAEVMMPMRDGAKLHAVILRPEGSENEGEKLPFMMERTPYGVDEYTSDSVNGAMPELAKSGYIFVFGDIRGRYESEGTFVMNRPIVAHDQKQGVDETTDTRDTIDWLLKNISNNSGKVGVLGISYPGFLAMMAGIDAHPAVKAISPQAPMTDIWMGDDFFHNGAFRETYGFDYVQQLEAQKTDVRVQSRQDMFDFFLEHVNFAGAAAAAGMTNLPTAQAFLKIPEYSKFWQDMAVEKHLTKVEVPTLEVGGWWDQEDMWGPQAEYAALKPHDKKHEVFLVLGPWNHGGWVRTTRHLGALDFGGPIGDEYRRTIEAPFFEHYLKGAAGFDLKDTASFRTGVNTWERYDTWPPKVGFAPKKLYLLPDKKLGFAAQVGSYDVTAAAYVADPADPVPYRQRPIQPTYGDGSKWRTWLVEDQRYVSQRKDLANFTTPVLDHDLTVTGDVVADIFAATTGTDGDLVVKLIDVYPDDAKGDMAGYQLMIVDEIFRGRYRNSFEHPEAVKTSEVVEYKWSLHGADHTFLKGHKMMVEVQSSWFPLYDRNPQTFVSNIMTAPASAYRAETVSIYGSAKYPSHLEIPVADQ